jgi:RNA methyltransferase, TrmH family
MKPSPPRNARPQPDLLTVCGLSSVKAVAAVTPELIERLFFDEDHAPQFSEICKRLAQTRKTYRLVSGDELVKIANTSHHQGAAVVMRSPLPRPVSELKNPQSMLVLHDVLNPHNIGAIMRSVAFFGSRAIAVSKKTLTAAMTAAAWRIAEGGLSHVDLYAYEATGDLTQWAELNGLVTVAAVRPAGGAVVTFEAVRERARGKGLVVCLGNEENGLPHQFVAACGDRFSIPGSGKIESLNVSVTAAICLEKLSAT